MGTATSSQLPRRFRIGDWQVDQLQGIIQKGEEIARLRPLAMRFLVYLAERAPEPISINDLVREVWSPRVVGDDSVYVAVRELRQKLGDDARHPQYIETIPKRGVRIVAEVRLPSTTEQAAGKSIARTNESAHSHLSAFVGRDRILADLDACIDSAQSKRGRVVFLAGEPGIGKTRTAQEFADRAELRGAFVHTSWCDGSLVAPPCWPWIRLLRSMLAGSASAGSLQHVGRDACALLAAILPEMRATYPDLPEAPDLPPERMTFALAQAIASFVTRLAELHPLILILDDVHLADEQSLAVLTVVAKEISRARIMLVCTFRDTEVERSHPLAGILADLSRLAHYDRITLSGLARDDVAQLLAPVTGAATRTIDSIMAATDGNSLFVTEIIRAIAARPSPTRVHSPVPIPQSLREVILGRLRHLTPDCRKAVDIASVIGQEFAPETVESVGDFDVETVDRTVDEALRSGVFAPTPDGDVRFAHALIRDAIYDELPRRRRVDLHRAIAQALVASFDRQHESGSHPEAIAHHFQEAGLISEAIDYWEQAADIALHRSAHGEQIRRLEQALHLLSTINPSRPGDGGGPEQREIDEREIQFRLVLGNAHNLVEGAGSAAVATQFARALELCNRHPDGPELDRPRFQAVDGLWSFHAMRLDTDETRALVRLQSRLAERADSDGYRLLASKSAAITRFFEGDYALSLESLAVATQHYQAALARRIARGTAGPWRSPALLCPLYHAWCLTLAGRADEGRNLVARSLAEACQLGTHAHVQALTYVAAVWELLREVDKAKETCEEIIGLAERFGYSSWLAVAHCVRGWTLSYLGDPDVGLAEVRQGWDGYRASGAKLSFTYRACFLADALRRAGHLDEAIKVVEDTLDAGREKIEHFFDAELLRSRGECAMAQGDQQGALSWFGKALELAGNQGAGLLELRAATSLLRCKPSDRTTARRLQRLKDDLGGGVGDADSNDAADALAMARA